MNIIINKKSYLIDVLSVEKGELNQYNVCIDKIGG